MANQPPQGSNNGGVAAAAGSKSTDPFVELTSTDVVKLFSDISTLKRTTCALAETQKEMVSALNAIGTNITAIRASYQQMSITIASMEKRHAEAVLRNAETTDLTGW